ncbi:S41 family peptidase [Psychrobium sp. nBUS_13]|uniref:S41 family peptidase n=1 Tax=Psychrobium sp. nBUS_13 TaxID=3395319 RepID=UPI003EB89114
MKLIPVITALALNLSLVSHYVSAQSVSPENSTTSIADQLSLSNIQHENLVLLGQVWGFLKYHHPTIASGKLDWDKQLIDFLPKYLSLRSTDDRNRLLTAWIDKLGPVAICFNCQKTADNAVIKPDQQWFHEESISTELRMQLANIYQNRHQGSQHYVLTSDVGGPTFSNEKPYKKDVYPDPAHRLIALYRYWNMIHYFFPHKDIMDTDWNRALGNHLSDIYLAETGEQYQFALAKLITDIGDGHAFLAGLFAFQSAKGINFPRFKTEIINNKLIVTNFYDNELKTLPKLEIGDELIAINGATISDMINERRPYIPSSTEQGLLRRVAVDLVRSDEKQLSVEYIRNGQKHSVVVPLYSIEDSGIFSPPRNESIGYKVLENNIGYIDLSNITQDEIETIKSELGDTKALIIDIRGYPKDFVLHSLGGWLVDKKIPFARFTAFNINNPGEIKQYVTDYLKPIDKHYKNHVVVLVNENSISSSEYTAMAFRATNRATIIGRPTDGSDGDVSIIKLPGNITTAISGLGVFYPNGEPTQRIGIIPDVIVEQTVAGIKDGQDEVLNAALKYVSDKL